MSPPKSMLTRIIDAAAHRLAQDPRIPIESRAAFQVTAVHVFETAVSDLVGAESWRLRGWKIAPSARAARRARILAAISVGESLQAIAQREQVSHRWVRKLKAAAVAGNHVRAELLDP